MVKCWDLEANKVIRHYHGHLSGVYSLSLHPTLDVLVTAGRDATARVSYKNAGLATARTLTDDRASVESGLGYANEIQHLHTFWAYSNRGGRKVPRFGSSSRNSEHG